VKKGAKENQGKIPAALVDPELAGTPAPYTWQHLLLGAVEGFTGQTATPLNHPSKKSDFFKMLRKL
jgi:hypothetical protein